MDFKKIINDFKFFGPLLAALACTTPESKTDLEDDLRADVAADTWRISALPAGSRPVTMAEGRGSLLGEPVAPTLLRLHPHLAPYIGHLILGNQEQQVILAGVPTVPSKELWQPIVVAVFERHKNSWRQVPGAQRLQLGLTTSGGDRFYPAALSFAIKDDAVELLMSYRSDKSDLNIPVTYRLTARSRSLEILFTDFMETRLKTPARYNWRLRVLGAGGLADKKGKTAYLLHDPATAAILGLTTLKSETKGSDLILTATGNAYKPGLQIFFGQHAAGEAPWAARTIDLCRSEGQKNAYPAFATCFFNAPIAVLDLRLPVPNREDGIVARTVKLEEMKGDLALTLNPKAGERRTILVEPKTSYRISADEAGELAEKKVFSLKAGDVARLDLARKPHVRLKLKLVQLDKDVQAPHLLRLQRKTLNGSPEPVDLGAQFAGFFQLPDGHILIERWPVSLDLPQGRYQWEIASAHRGPSCGREITLSQASTVSCDLGGGPTPRLPQTFLPASPSEMPRTQLLAQFWGAKFADALAPDDEDFENDTAPANLSLVARDPNQGIYLKLWGTDARLRAKWHAHAGRRRGAPLDLFARFAQEEAPQKMLELSCPAPTMDAATYEGLIKKLAPKSIQVLGCGGRAVTEQQLALLMKYSMDKEQAPILATAAAPNDAIYFGVQAPRLWTADAGAWKDAWLKGDFSVGSGAFILPLRSGNGQLVSRLGRQVQITVALHRLPGANPTRLVVLSEKDTVLNMPLPQNSLAYQEIPLSFRLKGPRQLIRLEVRGRHEGLAEAEGESILATSQLIRL